jgi:acyl-coenzyme A thioesterase PaaI-like protein
MIFARVASVPTEPTCTAQTGSAHPRGWLSGRMLGLRFDVDDAGNPIRDLWDRLSGLPGGRTLFSRAVGMMAPYTGTIRAKVVDLGRGRSEVRMDDRRFVRNHLRSVHAIALANLAELTGNVALAYSMPDDARFIVAGIDLDYVKKARGPITGRCECPVPESSERCEYRVPVTLHDASGDVVVRATLRTLVGPKRHLEHAPGGEAAPAPAAPQAAEG